MPNAGRETILTRSSCFHAIAFILLTSAIIFLLELAVLHSHGLELAVTNVQGSAAQTSSRGGPPQNDYRGIVEAVSELLVAIFTYTLWRSTRALWIEARWQREANQSAQQESLKLAQVQAEASKSAAEAALMALDRPWLFIEQLKSSRKEWEERSALPDWNWMADELYCDLIIRNYGKAPAQILSVKGHLFHTPAWRIPDHVQMPEGVEDIPPPASVGPSLQAAPEARRRVVTESQLTSMPGIGGPISGHASWDPVLYPCVIEGGQASERLYFRASGAMKAEKGHIYTNLIFMIQITYSGVDGQPWMLLGTYKGNSSSSFERFLGTPYNQHGRLIQTEDGTFIEQTSNRKA